MIHVQLLNLLNARLLVIHKYLEIDVAQQIQVHLVTIVSDGHHKSAILIKKTDLFAE